MNIKLGDFIARARTGIRQLNADLGLAAGLDSLRLDTEIVEAEGRIAEPIAEGKQGLPGAECIGPVVGGFVVVEVRQVADRVREGDRQLAAWIHIAEQNVCRRRAAFLPKIEALEDCRHMLRYVVNGQGAAVDQKYDRGRSGLDDLPDEF